MRRLLITIFALLGAGSAHAQYGGGIQVQNATYGANLFGMSGNATYSVASDCNGQVRCDYFVSTGRLGDPAYGHAKNFVVDYSCGDGRVLRAGFNEEYRGEMPPALEADGHMVTLECAGGWDRPPRPGPRPGPGPRPPRPGPRPGPGPGRGGLYVVSAYYGLNCRGTQYYRPEMTDVTRYVQYSCQGQYDCAYRVDVRQLGDPAYLCRKDFQIQYQCPQDRYPRTAFVGPEADGQVAFLSCR